MLLGITLYAIQLAVLLTLLLSGALPVRSAPAPGDAGPDREAELPEIEEASSSRPFTSIAVGSSHACALTDAGAAVCWDIASGEERDAPAGTFDSVVVRRETTCGIARSGEVSCWLPFGHVLQGHERGPMANAPPGRYAALSFDAGNSCALTVEGRAVCWKSSGNPGWPEALQAPAGVFSEISLRSWGDTLGSSYVTACARSTAGEIVCWQYRNHHQQTIERFAGLYRSVHVFRDAVCALSADGALLSLYGSRSYEYCGYLDDPDEESLAQLSVGNSHACAITDAGGVICGAGTALGFSGRKRVMSPPESPADPFVSLSVGDADGGDEAFACALTKSGEAMCWANEDNKRPAPEPPAGGYVDLADGYGHTCALDERGRIDCWGWNNYGQTDAPPGTWTSVSAGHRSTCAIGEVGDLVCWGAAYTDEDGLPLEFSQTQYRDVSVGTRILCAVTVEHRLSCRHPFWVNKLAETPQGNYSAVRVGWQDDVCALTVDAQMICWNRDYPELEAITHAGSFSALSVGPSSNVCAIGLDGRAHCWAAESNAGMQTRVGPYAAISAGTDEACALTLGGDLDCWRLTSRSASEQGYGPRQMSTTELTALSTSLNRRCALASDGRVFCDGDRAYELWPTDPFVWH